MRRKRIYLNTDKSKYCTCFLFGSHAELVAFYKESCPDDGEHGKVLGVSRHFYKEAKVNGRWKSGPETGHVLLSVEHCGAGVVSHEFMHAVMWAWKHSRRKKHHPFVIKSMVEEERLLHNLTFAVRQFYGWFWKVEKCV
jgi:hypothetical protein